GEELVLIAGMSEPLLLEDLIRVSLIASGIPDEGIVPYAVKMMELLESAPVRSGSEADDAGILLEWMHQNILTRYIQQQTTMNTLLDKGTYNCVSSAVMYLILLRSRDIPVHGVLTADHAFCRVEGIDVETTTAYGFDPGTRRDAIDSFTRRTGFSYVPPGNYRQRQDIGEKELISLIYQNRLSGFQRNGKWEDAVGLARDRWALAGSQAAENDFRVSITNYAADLDRRKMEIEGLVFLNKAALLLGEEHNLEDTASVLLGNAVTYYLRAGKTDESDALLNNKELISLVPESFVDERLRETREKSLEKLLKTALFEEASAAVNLAYSEQLISQTRWSELSLYLWSIEAKKQASGGDWLKGWLFLKDAPEESRQIPDWNRMEETYRHNSEIVFHNRFTNAVRGEHYSEAGEILDEALGFFPDSGMLGRDRETLGNLQ
ncbi:MAG: hypothetical protein KAH21_05650, partial [Spirochaetaceae bacterium]|nr:hypothetical protein [Spirochaetaceae bacterium]